MERYGKYKDSGVEWMGEIPEEWKTKKIKHNCYVKARVGWKGLKYSEFLTKGYSYLVTGTDFKNGRIDWKSCYHIDKDRYEEDPYIQLKNEDLLITKDGTIGKLAIVNGLDKPACLNSGIFVVRSINKDFSTLYLYWILTSILFSQFNEFTSYGSTIQHLYQNVFVEFWYPFPTLQEQTAIANYLDRKTTEIDALIAQKEHLITLYEEKKTALINQAVTKGIDPDGKLKDSGIDWLGEIPEEWKVKRLRYVGDCKNGVSAGADYFGSGFPFVSYTDVYNNVILPEEVKGLAKSTESDQENYSVEYGDVFFTRTSETVEEIGIASTCLKTIDQAIFAGFLIRFRPYREILYPGYSKYYFRSNLHRYFFVKEMNLVTRASLSQELLKRLPVILPCIEEQKEISNYLDTETARIDAKITKAKKIIELQKEYRTALISEVVTGKVKVSHLAPEEIPS